MSDNLENLTDAELSERVAVECAGCVKTEHPDDWTDANVRQVWFDASKSRTLISIPYSVRSAPGKFAHSWTLAAFATSADAVLPLLEKVCYKIDNNCGVVTVIAHLGYKIIDGKMIAQDYTGWGYQTRDACAFARAACIALLRAERAKKGGKA